jgi:hypothetical protein
MVNAKAVHHRLRCGCADLSSPWPAKMLGDFGCYASGCTLVIKLPFTWLGNIGTLEAEVHSTRPILRHGRRTRSVNAGPDDAVFLFACDEDFRHRLDVGHNGICKIFESHIRNGFAKAHHPSGCRVSRAQR